MATVFARYKWIESLPEISRAMHTVNVVAVVAGMTSCLALTGIANVQVSAN